MISFRKLLMSMRYHYKVWRHVRVSKRFSIWPEYCSYRTVGTVAGNFSDINKVYSVWYAKNDKLTSYKFGTQLSFADILANDAICAEKLIETKLSGALKRFTVIAAQDKVSGRMVVLDGNHRLLCALKSHKGVAIDLWVLTGYEWPSHPDLEIFYKDREGDK